MGVAIQGLRIWKSSLVSMKCVQKSSHLWSTWVLLLWNRRSCCRVFPPWRWCPHKDRWRGYLDLYCRRCAPPAGPPRTPVPPEAGVCAAGHLRPVLWQGLQQEEAGLFPRLLPGTSAILSKGGSFFCLCFWDRQDSHNSTSFHTIFASACLSLCWTCVIQNDVCLLQRCM